MYKIYCDDKLLYNTSLGTRNFHVPELELELNRAGSFSFVIYPQHPYYRSVKRLSSTITVYQKGTVIFRGRALDENCGFYNERKVLCEGELAFLNDSVQRPYDFFSGDKHTTIQDFFRFLIENHNSQVNENRRFKVGNVTVTDGNNYIVRKNEDYSNTFEEIKKKLIEVYGGYLWVRHEADGNYIDYLQDFSTLSSQPVKFGWNLIDFSKNTRGGDIETAIIPLGAKDEATGERVTIKSVNNGIDYVSDLSATEKYRSKIYKVINFDNVTTPEELLKKAQEAVEKLSAAPTMIELTAVDLAAQNTDFSAFHLGVYVKADSAPHGLNQVMLVTKLSIKIMNPEANRLKLGAVFSSGSDRILTGIDSAKKELNLNIERSEKNIRADTVDKNGIIDAINKSAEQLKVRSDALDFTIGGAENRSVINVYDSMNNQVSKIDNSGYKFYTGLNSDYLTFSSALSEKGYGLNLFQEGSAEPHGGFILSKDGSKTGIYSADSSSKSDCCLLADGKTRKAFLLQKFFKNGIEQISSDEIYHSGNLLIESGYITITPVVTISGDYEGEKLLKPKKDFTDSAIVFPIITNDSSGKAAVTCSGLSDSGFLFNIKSPEMFIAKVGYIIVEMREE